MRHDASRFACALRIPKAAHVAAYALAALGACDEGGAPQAAGDRVERDVEASALLPPAGDAATVDDANEAGSPYGYAAMGDGYAPASFCDQCACPAGSFCFGGAAGDTGSSGACDHLDASPNAPPQIGCMPLPDACSTASSPCECLLACLAPQVPCYLECTGPSPVAAFCPSSQGGSASYAIEAGAAPP